MLQAFACLRHLRSSAELVGGDYRLRRTLALRPRNSAHCLAEPPCWPFVERVTTWLSEKGAWNYGLLSRYYFSQIGFSSGLEAGVPLGFGRTAWRYGR